MRRAAGGGGGGGHPFDREPKRVLTDVLGGYVSREAADRDYGVILDVGGEAIDIAATKARRADRPMVDGMFHRYGYRDILE